MSAMTCSLAVSAGRGVCRREVSLMKHRCVEEEGGKGVREVCLASPSVLLHNYHKVRDCHLVCLFVCLFVCFGEEML